MRIKPRQISWDEYLDQNLEDRARDKFNALPDLYTSTDGEKRYANIQDAVDGISKEEWIEIARCLRDDDFSIAGAKLGIALNRICESAAEEELEEEYENGKAYEDEIAEMAENMRQRMRDDKLTGD